MRRARNIQRFQSEITPQTMINMNDKIIRFKRASFGNKVLRLTATRAVNQPIAKNILFGHDDKVVKDKPLLER